MSLISEKLEIRGALRRLNKSNTEKKTITCWNCRLEGHLYRNCETKPGKLTCGNLTRWRLAGRDAAPLNVLQIFS
ncbi:hypothetical protein X975_08511, partial [Stegodyphus mimosarum]